jgi:beta-glucosidase
VASEHALHRLSAVIHQPDTKNATDFTTSFPSDFTWGVATSAYQIEGAAEADGRTPSVWDGLCDVPDAIFGGQNGAIACDHYNRMPDDVALMQQLGVGGYRFSISWSRVLPEGTGSINAAGLGFYDRLVDRLLEAGIQPWATLFHWDFPTCLYHRGGWLNRDSAQWFAEYADVMTRALGDRVSQWMTHNEPQCFIGLGHRDGIHAPGLKLGWADTLLAGHHALLGHGLAVQTMRASAPQPLKIGWAPVACVAYPATDSEADIEAARTQTFAIREKHQWNNTWFSDPACLGHYPEDGLKLWGKEAPSPAAGDMEIIHQPLDFYGANLYQGTPTRMGEKGPETVPWPKGMAWTHFDWPVTPEILRWGPRFLQERYNLPIAVTENGLASTDWPAVDGQVHDQARIDFTHRHLQQLGRAIEDGVDVRAYFHWSLMDNFEWAEGYRRRFGLIHVDFETQKRTPKNSYHWYKNLIKSAAKP